MTAGPIPIFDAGRKPADLDFAPLRGPLRMPLAPTSLRSPEFPFELRM
jgi:hypothetical protein